MQTILFLLYQLLTLLMLPLFLLFLSLRLSLRPEYRTDLLQRFGLYPRTVQEAVRGKRVLWIHAVSVGEALSASLFVQALRRQYPRAVLVFSSGTPTGRAAARQHLKEVDFFIYFPLDFWVCVRSAIAQIRPSLFIFLETELWPNFLHTLRARKIPAILVNGRLSDRSIRRYRAARFFFSSVLDNVSLCLMQTEADADAIRALGAPHVQCTGNLKYDQAIRRAPVDAPHLRAALRLTDGERLMMAGSLHEGEDEAVLLAYRILCDATANTPIVLLMAPRHLTRLLRMEQAVAAAGYRSIRKQALTQHETGRPPVILLDTLGEMAEFYAIADLIFVGGSLVPVGGHNVLEAAAFKKPLFFGPHMSNFRNIADQMKKSGGGMEVSDGEALGREMARLIANPTEYAERGARAYQVVLDNQGAVQRNLSAIAPWMPAQPGVPGVPAGNPMAWIWRRRGGLAEIGLLPLTGLSMVYGAFCRLRVGLYRGGLLPTRRVSCPVISVGNLTVGGTGKTPLVIFLAEQYQRRGDAVGIVSRGYGGDYSGPAHLVSDGDTAAKVGDEPCLMARRLPNVPIVVAKSRYSGCQMLRSKFKLELILLDDGFQHLSLHRDLNLLLMDATNPFGNGALLPRGPLREPLAQMKRADVIILTRHETGAPLPQGLHDEIPLLRCRFVPTALMHLTCGTVHPLTLLTEGPVLAFCGIGNPEAFTTTLTQAGADIVEMIGFRDHHSYTLSDLLKIQRRAGPDLRIVTTEKDGVKIQPLLLEGLASPLAGVAPPPRAKPVEPPPQTSKNIADSGAFFALRMEVQFCEEPSEWGPLLLRKEWGRA
jgi:tetraacyldisaccharide 4'-kinase